MKWLHIVNFIEINLSFFLDLQLHLDSGLRHWRFFPGAAFCVCKCLYALAVRPDPINSRPTRHKEHQHIQSDCNDKESVQVNTLNTVTHSLLLVIKHA